MSFDSAERWLMRHYFSRTTLEECVFMGLPQQKRGEPEQTRISPLSTGILWKEAIYHRHVVLFDKESMLTGILPTTFLLSFSKQREITHAFLSPFCCLPHTGIAGETDIPETFLVFYTCFECTVDGSVQDIQRRTCCFRGKSAIQPILFLLHKIFHWFVVDCFDYHRHHMVRQPQLVYGLMQAVDMKQKKTMVLLIFWNIWHSKEQNHDHNDN